MTKQNYIRVKVNGRQIPFQRFIYRALYGTIPPGHIIHHRDGNIFNNNPNNLQCLTQEVHTRLHRGWRIIGRRWVKRCARCKKVKPATEFYTYPDHRVVFDKCKTCYRK